MTLTQHNDVCNYISQQRAPPEKREFYVPHLSPLGRLFQLAPETQRKKACAAAPDTSVLNQRSPELRRK